MLLFMGLFSGLCAGLFGVGGGIVLVPLLMMAGFSIHQATVLSLQYVCLTGLVGTLTHARLKHVVWSISGLLALGGVFTAPLGAWLASLMSRPFLTGVFVGILVTSTVLVLTRNRWGSTEQADVSVQTPWLQTLGIGILAGLLAGLLGVGGGFIMTPLLLLSTPYPMKQCVGTSLAAVVLIALSGSLAHWWAEPSFWGQVFTGFDFVTLVGGGMAGSIIGARWTKTLPEARLQQAFVAFSVFLGGYLIWSAALT